MPHTVREYLNKMTTEQLCWLLLQYTSTKQREEFGYAIPIILDILNERENPKNEEETPPC